VGSRIRECAHSLSNFSFSKKSYSQLQNKNDPNISFCPVDHPFIPVSKLETEGQKLLEAVAGLLYNSQYVELILFHVSLKGSFRDIDLLSALLNSWANLVKLRPAALPLVISTLRSWTPTALGGLSASSVKSIEKSIRILLVHISRYATLRNRHPCVYEVVLVSGLQRAVSMLDKLLRLSTSKGSEWTKLQQTKRNARLPLSRTESGQLQLRTNRPTTTNESNSKPRLPHSPHPTLRLPSFLPLTLHPCLQPLSPILLSPISKLSPNHSSSLL